MLSLCVIVFCMSRLCGAPFCLCDVVCLFMCLWYGVNVLFVDRFHWFVLCELFCYCLGKVCFGVCVLFVACCVAVCCFNGLSCVYGLLLCCVRARFVLVCVFCSWCVVLLFVGSVVCRACMVCCCVVFVLVFLVV